MNELIKTTQNENGEILVNIEKLKECKTFEELFIAVNEIKFSISCKEEYRRLQEVLQEIMLTLKFDTRALIHLKDILLLESVHALKIEEECEKSEKELQDEIVKNFDLLFPEYTFIAKEYKIKIGRVDILAKAKEDGRPVIIELKKGKANPTKQLLAYATEFANPVLIGVTEERLDYRVMHEDIKYFVYSSERLRVESIE
jgi:RecB family endonuclease NucS